MLMSIHEAQSPNPPCGNGIVLIHRDMLDNEEATQGSAWGTSNHLSSHQPSIIPSTPLGVQILSSHAVDQTNESGQRVGHEQAEMGRRDYERDDNEEEKGLCERVVSSDLSEQQHASEETIVVPLAVTAHDGNIVQEVNDKETKDDRKDKNDRKLKEKKKEKEKEEKEGRRKGKEKTKPSKYTPPENPKNRVVAVDEVMPKNLLPPTPSPAIQLLMEVEDAQVESDYVDLSAQMIHDMNTGRFDVVVSDKNVFQSYIH